MQQTSVQGSVTLRKLRTGATASVSLSSTKQLFQLYSTDTAGNVTYAPDWTVSGNEPVVSVNAVSSQGSLSSVSVVWRINGTLATSIAGIMQTDSGSAHTLTIAANLAQVLNYTSGTLSADITFTDESGAVQTVTKTETIRIQKAVASGYNVMINCNKGYVDNATSASNPTALEAVIYDGTTKIADPAAANITFKWYDSTAADASPIGTGSAYNITDPDQVNGAQLFLCRAVDGSNNVLDSEGILIVDNSDPYRIVASVQQSKGGSVIGIPSQDNATSVSVASDNDKTTVTFSVQTSDGTAYGSVSSWTVEKRHADTMMLIAEVAGEPYTQDTSAVDYSYNTKTLSNAASVSIDVLDADYSSVGSGSATRHDTEVIATATATL